MSKELLEALEKLVYMAENGFKIFNSEELKHAQKLIKKIRRLK